MHMGKKVLDSSDGSNIQGYYYSYKNPGFYYYSITYRAGVFSFGYGRP
jgi:hypothetical protein